MISPNTRRISVILAVTLVLNSQAILRQPNVLPLVLHVPHRGQRGGRVDHRVQTTQPGLERELSAVVHVCGSDVRRAAVGRVAADGRRVGTAAAAARPHLRVLDAVVAVAAAEQLSQAAPLAGHDGARTAGSFQFERRFCFGRGRGRTHGRLQETQKL